MHRDNRPEMAVIHLMQAQVPAKAVIEDIGQLHFGLQSDRGLIPCIHAECTPGVFPGIKILGRGHAGLAQNMDILHFVHPKMANPPPAGIIPQQIVVFIIPQQGIRADDRILAVVVILLFPPPLSGKRVGIGEIAEGDFAPAVDGLMQGVYVQQGELVGGFAPMGNIDLPLQLLALKPAGQPLNFSDELMGAALADKLGGGNGVGQHLQFGQGEFPLGEIVIPAVAFNVHTHLP